MEDRHIRSIVIVGGGTAGWMTAAALARVVGTARCSIRLVESEEIGTVGVGEATIPAIHDFNRRLGIDEAAFMRETRATFKLGIEFVNWRRHGDVYMHPFGSYGRDMNGVSFHHYWASRRLAGDPADFGEYCMARVAAKLGRFAYPTDDRHSVYSTYAYAFHLDASRYAQFLRRLAESLGVVRTEGRVVAAQLRASDGHIDHVVLDGGEAISGELFIDCSGFRGVLIEQALHTGYTEWLNWLPCDSALALPTKNVGAMLPHTRAIAHRAGWQWRIPLQHRTGNGHVFSSAHMKCEEAADLLGRHVEGRALAEPRLLRFVPGKRNRMWNRNCVAIGLSGGFLEPLESTSIFLIQAAIMKLLEFFPDREFCGPDIRAFNESLNQVFDEVRNFVILHYKATERDDSEFWRYCRNMVVPDELDYRMRLFHERGVASHRKGELFVEANWVAVYIGQGIVPAEYDPRVDCLGTENVRARLAEIRAHVSKAAVAMSEHSTVISRCCAAPDEVD